VQVVTDYLDSELDLVLQACERMDHHLTAAIVSNDVAFQHKVLGSTVNGTTYMGGRARTTGAPQNHWFGPAGDPRGAGIGTPEVEPPPPLPHAPLDLVVAPSEASSGGRTLFIINQV
jgi:hypothetical protein